MTQEGRFKSPGGIHNGCYKKSAGRPTSRCGNCCPTYNIHYINLLASRPWPSNRAFLNSGRAAENRVIELGAFISAAGSPDPKRCRCSSCARLPLRPSQAPSYAPAEPPKRARRTPSSARPGRPFACRPGETEPRPRSLEYGASGTWRATGRKPKPGREPGPNEPHPNGYNPG